jgi:hypothetical protein
MGYFSNGTEGDFYRERYCDCCEFDKDESCPIWNMHVQHCYNGSADAKHILDSLIPRSKDKLDNDTCFFFVRANRALPFEDGE